MNLLKKILRNKLALAGFVFIALTILLSLLGYLITPDASPAANRMFIQAAAKPMGFKMLVLKTWKPGMAHSAQSGWTRMISGKEDVFDYTPITAFRIRDQKIYAATYLGEGVSGDTLVIPVNELEPAYLSNLSDQQIGEALLDDGYISEMRFWFGTDRYGRDMLSRMIIGARISLVVGLIAVVIALLLGVTLGLAAGYFRGWVDDAITWLINVVWSIPTLLLVIAFSIALGKGFWQVFVAVGLTMWVDVARIVRGQVLSIREKEYIEAARALGYGNLRIIFVHILPNITAPLIVVSTANFASAILLEAGLSFLGLGVQPPMPSWGMMIKEHFGYIILDGAHLAFIPGIAIMLLVMAFNFLGNGLRDALDVKISD